MTPARIVVIEDDRVVARDIAQQLARIGHTVVGTSARGDEALALTLATKPTLVLMDVRLEGNVDGIDAAEQIRAQSRVPVVFLTAYADDPTVLRASKAEPFGYLLKPFEDSQLRTAIEMALYKHAAEQRLRASERRYAVTLASIGDAVIATDANGDVTFMNPAAEKLTAFPARDALGLPRTRVFQPSPMIESSEAPILDDDGASSGAVLVFRDVTERRRAAEAEIFRQANERLELALQGSNIAFWEFVLPDGTLETAKLYGQSFWKSYGYHDEIPFETVAERWHPEDRDRVIAAIRAYLSGEAKQYALECRMQQSDGTYRMRMVRGVAIRDEAGVARRFMGTSVDITDRITLEEALRSSEERYRNTFENAPVGLVHTDFENYSVLRVNQTYVNMTGWSREELLGPKGMEIIHPDDREAVRARFVQLTTGDLRAYATQFRILHRSGSYISVRLTVSLSRDSPNERPYLLAAVEDISERLELEAALQTAKELAEASNRAKDEFLANVSHEIRTPMNAILGMTELVLDTALDEAQRQSLVTVKSAASNLLALINDLLDFAKIEAGKMELDPTELQLRELLGDAMRVLAVRAQRKGLSFLWNVAPEVPEVLTGDAGRLRQVLINLVGNAIKFTARGEVRVDVTRLELTPDEVTLKFEVRDTGIGIPEARQASIFRPFEQEDMSTTRRYGGTGLGLTIAARFVEMMGGTITVESAPQRGSTFTFSLLFPWSEHPSLGTLSPDEPDLAAPSPRPTNPLRVLVAEDNSFNSLLLEKLLSSRGHSVRVAQDGVAALTAARSGEFELLLLDLHMPELDGFGVIAALREHERTAGGHLPTIALTARSRAEDRARCFAAGMDEFLAKPIHAATLWATIDRISKLRASDGIVSAGVLLATCGGNANVLDAIRTGLHARLPDALAVVKSSFEARDAARLGEAAHKLAGMLAAFSTQAGALASSLEDVAGTGDLGGAGALIERVEALTPSLLAAIDRVTIASLEAEAGG